MKNNSYFKSENELKESAPLLFGIPKEDPFSVPENYFEALPTQIQERCLNSKKDVFSFRVIILSWYQYFRYKPAYALAAVSLVFVISFGLFQYFRMDSATSEMAAVIQPIQVIHATDQLDEELLADALVEQGYFEEKKQVHDSKVEEQKIINYLLNENIEVATITDEL